MKMDAIKISVEVSVDLSENTQSFIKSLLNGTIAATTQKPASVASANPESKPTSAQSPKPQTPAAAPAPTKSVATPAPGAPAAPTKSVATPAPGAPAAQAVSSASKSIEDVRKMLVQKVNEHRDVIKQKLNEFGAPSVTKLNPSKYDDMYNFLNTL